MAVKSESRRMKRKKARAGQGGVGWGGVHVALRGRLVFGRWWPLATLAATFDVKTPCVG